MVAVIVVKVVTLINFSQIRIGLIKMEPFYDGLILSGPAGEDCLHNCNERVIIIILVVGITDVIRHVLWKGVKCNG